MIDEMKILTYACSKIPSLVIRAIFDLRLSLEAEDDDPLRGRHAEVES